MASIQEMRSALNGLINSDGAVSLPGLTFDSVVENMVEKKYATQLAEAEKLGDRENVKKGLKEYYQTTMKTEVESHIQNIKSAFGSVTAMVENLQIAAASAIASNAIPAVITTGSAASVANPAYALIENKTKVNTLLTSLKMCETLLISLLSSALLILFEVPSSVIALITTLATIKTIINAIPV